MTAPDPDCVFCRIVSGDIPADVVHSSDRVVAFRDLDPQAPTHVLLVPRAHYADAAALAGGEPETVAALVGAAAEVAEADGLDGHYRLVFNTGTGAGQSVFHTHLHLLGGRAMTWPPG
ncbi:MAG: HIT domain-containing protein [Nocardioidaceae bacterium]